MPACSDLCSGWTGPDLWIPCPGYVGPPPSQCTELSRPWDGSSGGAIGSHSVQVPLCYRFTTLFNLDSSLPMEAGLSLGELWLRNRGHS